MLNTLKVQVAFLEQYEHLPKHFPGDKRHNRLTWVSIMGRGGDFVLN